MFNLNDAQKVAVEAGDGPQLILAGAGSGKTQTIVHRIGHLISSRGYAPHRILAVTFTNKAAGELKERLSYLIGDDGGGVVSGTFHSISLRFLRIIHFIRLPHCLWGRCYSPMNGLNQSLLRMVQIV